jgi:hypothetical protein
LFYYETSWQIFDSITGDILLYGGDYEGPAGQTFIESTCIPDTTCTHITLFDSFGDGMDSTGSYSVSVDGITVVSSAAGDFNSHWKNYQINCAQELSPTRSLPGADATSDVSCDSSEILLEIEFTTDTYYYETSWEIYNSITGEVAMDRDDYQGPAGQTFVDKLCIPDNTCYYLTLHDSFGDGMDSTGSYSLLVDGTTVLSSSSGDFNSHWMNHLINCDSTA